MLGKDLGAGQPVYNQVNVYEDYEIPKRRIGSIDFSKQVGRKPCF